MKKLFRVLMLSALMGTAMACSQFSNRGTINKPFIGTANTESLSFNKVVLTDSSTTLHAVVHFTPGWWFRVADSSAVIVDGKKYFMTSIDGIPVNEQVTMPDSGVVHFTMTFPAIPADATALSFIEDVPQGYYVGDVDLTGTADEDYYLSQIPKDCRKPFADGPMPEPVFGYDSTTVNVHLLGYYPGAFTVYKNLTTLHGPVNSEKPEEFDENGNLTTKLALAAPARLNITFSDLRYYDGATLKPGETVDLYIDPHTFGKANMDVRDGRERSNSNAVYHNGHYSNLDNSHRSATGHPEFRMNLLTDNTAYYRMNGDDYTAHIINRYKALNDSIDAASMPLMLKEYQKNELNREFIEAATAAKNIAYSCYYNKYGKYGADVPADSIKTILSPENFRQIAELIDFNNDNLLLSRYSFSLGNTDSWRNAGVDAGKLETIRLYCEAYYQASAGELESSAADSLRALNEAFATDVEAHDKFTKAKLAAIDYSKITPTPEVSNDKLLEAIVKPHAGKVVMVDLWNTWCGPCRAALAANEPEKKGDLSSDDIVWIYIADESSPMPRYAEMINDISGIHYRVTDDQIAALRKQFDVDGIPYYILVDKKGKATGRPDLRDHSKFKSTILKELSR